MHIESPGSDLNPTTINKKKIIPIFNQTFLVTLLKVLVILTVVLFIIIICVFQSLPEDYKIVLSAQPKNSSDEDLFNYTVITPSPLIDSSLQIKTPNPLPDEIFPDLLLVPTWTNFNQVSDFSVSNRVYVVMIGSLKCKFCDDMLSEINKLNHSYDGKVSFFAIYYDFYEGGADPTGVSKLVSDRNIAFPIGLDNQREFINVLEQEKKYPYAPVTFIVNENGKIVYTLLGSGGNNIDMLKSEIDKITL